MDSSPVGRSGRQRAEGRRLGPPGRLRSNRLCFGYSLLKTAEHQLLGADQIPDQHLERHEGSTRGVAER